MDSARRLDDALRVIEELGPRYDEGNIEAAKGIAANLRSIFHQTASEPSLLSRVNGTYTRLSSSVGKAPHPQDVYAPMTEIILETPVQAQHVVSMTGATAFGGYPRFRPYLSRVRVLRNVQAPDWWKNEPVFVMDHSKVTRKDVVIWVADDQGGPSLVEKFARFHEALLHKQAVAAGGQLYYGQVFDMPPRDACFAALRQIGHEVLHSPELLKLAGRTNRPGQ